MKGWTNIVLLTAIWLLAILLVNPIGDFPLNDDFAYGRNVLNLLETGELHFDEWYSMTLLTQLFWGTAFCKMFGFSFTVLRMSTLVLAYFGVVSTYLLCRELGQNKSMSFFAALVAAFNPLFFSLSFTFMTDVPFFTFSVFSTLFFAKTLNGKGNSWLVLGSVFAVAATFTRQLGLMLPLSFAVAWLFRAGLRPKEMLRATLPFLLTLGLFLLYSNWLKSSQGSVPEGYGDFERLLHWFSWGKLAAVPLRLGVLSVYLGLFLLPMAVLLTNWEGLFPQFKNWKAWLGAALIVALVFVAWEKLPWGNMAYNFGVGPKLLKDGYFFLNVRPTAPDWVINCLKIIGLGGALVLFLLVKKRGTAMFSNVQPVAVYAIANLFLYGGYLMIDLHCFDRYFFQMLPFLLILLVPEQPFFPKKIATAASVVTLTIMSATSIATTHDYLAWNRARWQALDYLTNEKNIAPNRIDGGFEFNGWHKPGPRDPGDGKSWWWVDEDEYVVAFGDLGSFKNERGFPFQRWLPPGIDSVFVLKHD